MATTPNLNSAGTTPNPSFANASAFAPQIPHNPALTVQQAIAIVPWFDSNPYAPTGPFAGFVAGKAGPWSSVGITPLNGGVTYWFIGDVSGRHGSKWDIRARYGQIGSSTAANHRRLTEIDMEVQVWTPQDLAAYTLMLRALVRATERNFLYVAVQHPWLNNVHGISRLIYIEDDAPKIVQARATFRIRFREWIEQPTTPAEPPADPKEGAAAGQNMVPAATSVPAQANLDAVGAVYQSLQLGPTAAVTGVVDDEVPAGQQYTPAQTRALSAPGIPGPPISPAAAGIPISSPPQ
jgi:hypothetical protein